MQHLRFSYASMEPLNFQSFFFFHHHSSSDLHIIHTTTTQQQHDNILLWWWLWFGLLLLWCSCCSCGCVIVWLLLCCGVIFIIVVWLLLSCCCCVGCCCVLLLCWLLLCCGCGCCGWFRPVVLMTFLLAYVKKFIGRAWQTGAKNRFRTSQREIANSGFSLTRHKRTRKTRDFKWCEGCGILVKNGPPSGSSDRIVHTKIVVSRTLG